MPSKLSKGRRKYEVFLVLRITEEIRRKIKI